MENRISHQWAKKIAVAAIGGGVGMVLSNAAQATTATQTWHQGWVRCWGVNAAHKNDCLTGTSSCMSRDPKAHDPNAYVLMPAGVCTEVGGSAIPGARAAERLKMMQRMPPKKLKGIKARISLGNTKLYRESTAEYFSAAAKWAKQSHH